MSASEALNKRLFHGTGHYFSPGDSIDPINPGPSLHTPKEYDPTPRTYASSSMRDAQIYAHQAALSKEMLFAPVYEVGMQEPEMFAPELYNSTKPMTAKKIAGWGTWNFYGED
jgi:hypothetical protein